MFCSLANAQGHRAGAPVLVERQYNTAMDLQLQNKIALLVGGAGSIGQAVAKGFLREGATPVIADLPGRIESVADVPTVDIDVTDEGSVKSAVDRVISDHGRIDILVALAGAYHATPIEQMSGVDWDRILAINLKGTFLVCREVIPHLRGGEFGRVICLASLAGQVGGVVAGANYSASKAGVLSLVKSLAKQTPEPHVTVNAISPGPVEGDMTGAWSEEDRRAVLAKMPRDRFALPEEIADVVLFLSSPRAGYIDGARIDINGGLYMD
jgi:3-oxoacyl-[acyl-carrier protein] reductase